MNTKNKLSHALTIGIKCNCKHRHHVPQYVVYRYDIVIERNNNRSVNMFISYDTGLLTRSQAIRYDILYVQTAWIK